MRECEKDGGNDTTSLCMWQWKKTRMTICSSLECELCQSLISNTIYSLTFNDSNFVPFCITRNQQKISTSTKNVAWKVDNIWKVWKSTRIEREGDWQTEPCNHEERLTTSYLVFKKMMVFVSLALNKLTPSHFESGFEALKENFSDRHSLI